jgi:hypothetical protein
MPRPSHRSRRWRLRATIGSALAAGLLLLAVSPALAIGDYSLSDNDTEHVPNTNDWMQVGFGTDVSATFTQVMLNNGHSWGQVGSNDDRGTPRTPDSLRLVDTFSADGVGLSCGGGLPPNASCTVSGTNVTATIDTTNDHVQSATHAWNHTLLRGTITYLDVESKAVFQYGSNYYQVNAISSVYP